MLWFDPFSDPFSFSTKKLMAAVCRTLERFAETQSERVTLGEAARALEVASKLGRLATGLATERQEVSGPGGGAIPVDIVAVLDKVYGNSRPTPQPAEVVDVTPAELPQTSQVKGVLLRSEAEPANTPLIEQPCACT